jgi:putative membrane protein
MGWWMVFGMIWMVVFWGAIIALAIWAVSRLGEGERRDHADTPLEIARRRYARGEITREEFEELRRNLA